MTSYAIQSISSAGLSCKLHSVLWTVDVGPASFKEQARILYAPNSTEGNELMRRVAQAAACPADATRKSSTSASFFR